MLNNIALTAFATLDGQKAVSYFFDQNLVVFNDFFIDIFIELGFIALVKEVCKVCCCPSKRSAL